MLHKVKEILHVVEKLPGVKDSLSGKGCGAINLTIRPRPKPSLLSGYALGTDILLRVPTPVEEHDLAPLATILTHEVAHVVLPTWPPHGQWFRDVWCVLLSELLGQDVPWPTEGRRRLGILGAFSHFQDMIQEALDQGDLVL